MKTVLIIVGTVRDNYWLVAAFTSHEDATTYLTKLREVAFETRITRWKDVLEQRDRILKSGLDKQIQNNFNFELDYEIKVVELR